MAIEESLRMAAIAVFLIVFVPLMLYLTFRKETKKQKAERLAKLIKEKQAEKELLKICAPLENWKGEPEPDLFVSLLVSGSKIRIFTKLRFIASQFFSGHELDIHVDYDRKKFGFSNNTWNAWGDWEKSVKFDHDLDTLESFLRQKLGTNVVKLMQNSVALREREIAELERELQPA
jgi:hypothetical protein